MSKQDQPALQPRQSAFRLMLYGAIGTVIGLAFVLGLIHALGGELSREFLIFVGVVCVPATLLYLWTHRSPDNKRFIPK